MIDMMNAKWKRTVVLITLIVLAAGSLMMPAAASTEKTETAKTVRVGYVNFENYQEGGDGEYKRGFGYEYLQRVAYSTGWQYKYVYGSFSELFKKPENGEIDLMGDISYTAERAENISFSALPQGRENYYIYTTAEQEDIDPFDPSTLNGRSIGVTANSYQHGLLLDWVKENNYNCNVVEYDGSKEAAEALNSGKVDAMIMTDMASTGGYVPVESVGHAEFYFGVNKKRQDILNELNYALREIQTTDPYYNEVTYAKYITSSLSNGYLSNRERKWLDEHRNTVHLGYLTSNLPYCDETENGLLKGQLAALVNYFEEDFNIHVDARGFSDVDALINAAKDGEVDLFGPLYSDAWLAEQYGIINTNTMTSTAFILLYTGDYTAEQVEFALLVADVNGLKEANDALGHESGDQLIKNTNRCICKIFEHSPVFRIGGDEFVVILTGEDYVQRKDLLAELQENIMSCGAELNIEKGDFSAAYGMAEYNKETCCTVKEVFAKADEIMYACKKQMKQAE